MTQQALEFRQEIAQPLFHRIISGGESASIVGVSGVGKSNLFRHLLDPAVQAHYLGTAAENTLLVRVNLDYLPTFDSRSAYSHILDALEMSVAPTTLKQTIDDYHQALLATAPGDLLLIQHHFRRALRALFAAQPNRTVVFLFDQFDRLYTEADARLFANLRGLRESYKYQLCYLTFTRSPLPHLAASSGGREEFYELMQNNVLGLTPYTERDANAMLERIAKRTSTPLDNSIAKATYAQSGGHAGLHRALFLAQHNVNHRQASTQHHVVQHECGELWNSLSLSERRLLHQLIKNPRTTIDDNESAFNLSLKGIICGGKPFSPIFAAYVPQQPTPWVTGLVVDERQRGTALVQGERVKLSPNEYKMLLHLYEHAGEVLSHDALISAVWGADQLPLYNDNNLAALVRRIRKKIETDPSNPRYLFTESSHGYRLEVK